MSVIRRIAALSTLVVIAACQNDVTTANRNEDPKTEQAPTLRDGWIIREGTPVEVTFQVIDGRGVFEGDIDLGPIENIPRKREDLRAPQLGVVAGDLGRRWPNGRVPYVVSPTFTNPERAYGAMSHIQSKVVGVSFVPRQSFDADYITFSPTSNPEICGSSPVGRAGGNQLVLVRDGCSTGVVMHELGHALGFWHEQSRCDRDSFVQILSGNIRPGYESAFSKYCSGTLDIGAYSEGSIMHYRTTAFGKVVNGDTLQTINSLRGLNGLMGQRDSLHPTDTYTINVMYPAPPPLINDMTYPNGTPTASFNAGDPPTSFTLKYKITYYQYDYYNNTSNVSSYFVATVGSTTGLSLQDPARSFTSSDRCYVVQNQYEEWFMEHRYEITATYNNGTGVSTMVYLLPAMVATANCW